MKKIQMVRQFIIDEILFGDGAALTDEISFYDSGIIDSMGILELVNFIESTLGIKVKDDELIPENFETLQAVGAYLDRKEKEATDVIS